MSIVVSRRRLKPDSFMPKNPPSFQEDWQKLAYWGGGRTLVAPLRKKRFLALPRLRADGDRMAPPRGLSTILRLRKGAARKIPGGHRSAAY